MSRSVEIAPLLPRDRRAWEALARGYKKFYRTPTTQKEYDAAWRKLLDGDEAHGLGAKLGGRLVGIAHYFFHASVWAPKVCYLQDLFTAPAARGKGVARKLIVAVARKARAQGCGRYYWLTQEHNAVARVLYNKVAAYRGFIRYDYPLK